MRSDGRLYGVLKRTIDITGSALGLILTAPVQLGIAVAIYTNQGRPVFFRQPRPGKDDEIFELIKFRTMREPSPQYRTDEERLTALGRSLRASSLDELPSLWNVLKGDMSLVGPRPLLVRYLPHYSPEQARRHTVRPGVTGLAQARGRNAQSWEERFHLDLTYVDTRSLTLDLQILASTLSAVVKRKNINHAGHATMPPFDE